MAIAVAIGADAVVAIVMPRPVTALEAVFYDPRGVSLGELVVVVEDWAPVTITAGATDDELTVSAAGDLTPDQVVWWHPGTRSVGGPVRISEIVGTAVSLEACAPGALADGDTLRPLQAIVTIPAALAKAVGINYRIEWTATLDTGITYRDRVMVHVVMTPFHAAVDAAAVRRYVDARHPSVTRDSGWYREIARRASDRVERKLIATGRLPALVGDRALFSDAGLVALRIELANEGLYPSGHDSESYISTQVTELNIAVDEAVASSWVDRQQSGNPSDSDAVRPIGSIKLSRVS